MRKIIFVGFIFLLAVGLAGCDLFMPYDPPPKPNQGDNGAKFYCKPNAEIKVLKVDDHQSVEGIYFQPKEPYCVNRKEQICGDCQPQFEWKFFRDDQLLDIIQEKNVNYQFPDAGTYRVKLIVSGDEQQDVAQTTVKTINTSPSACAKVKDLGYRKRRITLSNSHDYDGEIVKIEINFGDGKNLVRTTNLLEPIQHIYPEFSGDSPSDSADDYKLRVTVWDDDGARGIDDETVYIYHPDFAGVAKARKEPLTSGILLSQGGG